MLLLLPFFAGLRYGVEGVSRGDYDWIQAAGAMGSHWRHSKNGLGSFPFPLFALFADNRRNSALAAESR